jgi:hypothetical protein
MGTAGLFSLVGKEPVMATQMTQGVAESRVMVLNPLRQAAPQWHWNTALLRGGWQSDWLTKAHPSSVC